MDFSTRLRGINPTNTVFYSPEPRAEVYCLLMNFKISKLAYYSTGHKMCMVVKVAKAFQLITTRESDQHCGGRGFDSYLELGDLFISSFTSAFNVIPLSCTQRFPFKYFNPMFKSPLSQQWYSSSTSYVRNHGGNLKVVGLKNLSIQTSIRGHCFAIYHAFARYRIYSGTPKNLTQGKKWWGYCPTRPPLPSAIHEYKHTTNNLSLRSDEDPTLETSASLSLNGGNLTFINIFATRYY